MMLHHSLESATVGKHIEISVIGMSCGGCAQRVQQALSACKGILQASVSHVEAKASVDYLPGQVTEEEIREIINKTGYRVG